MRYIIDHLESFVIADQLTGENTSLSTVDFHKYYLYIERICNLRAYMFNDVCILNLDLSEEEAEAFIKKIDGVCPYGKQYLTKFKNYRYATEVTFEFRLYKEEKAKQVLDVVLPFLKGVRE